MAVQAATKPKRTVAERVRRFLRKHKWDYLFLLPDLWVFVAFIFVPLFLSLFIAFKDYQALLGIFGSPWVGLENFYWTLTDDVFWIALRNTALYTLVMVPEEILVALILASLIHPLSSKAQTFFRVAYYLPAVSSGVIISMIWRWIFNTQYGLFNTLLRFVFDLDGVPWLTSPDWVMPSLMLSGVLMAPGAAVIIYLAALSKIPNELYEAAEIDGATAFQQWFKITVPLVKPTTLFLLVIHTINSFQIFEKVMIMTGGGPGYSSTVIVHQIYDNAFSHFDFGLAAAQALILFVIIVGFAVIQFKYFSTDVEY